MSTTAQSSELVPRTAAARLAELAAQLRIVMVSGPRQSGKRLC